MSCNCMDTTERSPMNGDDYGAGGFSLSYYLLLYYPEVLSDLCQPAQSYFW